MKYGILAIALTVFAGCSTISTAEPVDRQLYVSTLSAAVCYAYDELNDAGELADTVAFEEGFERHVRDFVLQQGIDESSWLAAKETYFTSEEHEKLLKMHFAWCITGLDEKSN